MTATGFIVSCLPLREKISSLVLIPSIENVLILISIFHYYFSLAQSYELQKGSAS